MYGEATMMERTESHPVARFSAIPQEAACETPRAFL